MQWDTEALAIVEAIPLPPMIAHFAKMDAESRARKKGLATVTAAIARETEEGYDRALGREAVKLLRAAARGEDVQLPEEFFIEEPGELYKIELCPAKFGASTMEKREQIRQILTPVRNRLKELGISRILMDKAQTSLMSHHVMRIHITGCANACFTPYFADFGILGMYRVGVKDAGCTQCGECAAYCSEHAITVTDRGPVIDDAGCVMCAGCTEVCGQGVLFTRQKGYKVVLGGTGSRHPRIARTAAEFTDAAGVLNILENAVRLLKETDMEGRVICLADVVERHGLEAFLA